ncbi:hypothetical protein EHP00_2409 [Ecytonucleospora hepatopenaei]|uniref:Uncharacterized protein n=1 Tax=Ecytonucleospora hepatopenaei TaxID=646526 RepID=A0A1W0E873_9MICR|nr:hypothetical protein EHP00_2409 [Ecytonucleospora hepatopenaei]
MLYTLFYIFTFLCNTIVKEVKLNTNEFYERYSIKKIHDNIDEQNLLDKNNKYYKILKSLDNNKNTSSFFIFSLLINNTNHTFLVTREYLIKNDIEYTYNFIKYKYNVKKGKTISFFINDDNIKYKIIDDKKYELFYFKKKKIPKSINSKNSKKSIYNCKCCLPSKSYSSEYINKDKDNNTDKDNDNNKKKTKNKNKHVNKYTNNVYKAYNKNIILILKYYQLYKTVDSFKNSKTQINEIDFYTINNLVEYKNGKEIEENIDFIINSNKNKFTLMALNMDDFIHFINGNEDEMTYDVKCKFNENSDINICINNFDKTNETQLEFKNIDELYSNFNFLENKNIIDNVLVSDIEFEEHYNIYNLYDFILHKIIIDNIKKSKNIIDFCIFSLKIQKSYKSKLFLVTKEYKLKKNTEIIKDNKKYIINKDNVYFTIKSDCNLQLKNNENIENIENNKNIKNNKNYKVCLIKRLFYFRSLRYEFYDFSKEKEHDYVLSTTKYKEYKSEPNEYHTFFENKYQNYGKDLKGNKFIFKDNKIITKEFRNADKNIIVTFTDYMLVNMDINEFAIFLNSYDNKLAYKTDVKIITEKNNYIKINIIGDKLEDIATYIEDVENIEVTEENKNIKDNITENTTNYSYDKETYNSYNKEINYSYNKKTYNSYDKNDNSSDDIGSIKNRNDEINIDNDTDNDTDNDNDIDIDIDNDINNETIEIDTDNDINNTNINDNAKNNNIKKYIILAILSVIILIIIIFGIILYKKQVSR